MATSENIKYCKEEIKVEMKSEVEGLQLYRNRKYAEYFEEDVSNEIVDEKNPQTNLVTYTCDICSKSYKSNKSLTQHIQSVHRRLKFPCIQCDKQFTQKSFVKRHVKSSQELEKAEMFVSRTT